MTQPSAQDYSNGIGVDRFGAAYVVGYTVSPDFPLATALQSSFRTGEAFLARIDDIDSSLPPPVISNIGPTSFGSSAGQFPITIFGANFLPGARVRIGGVPSRVIDVTDKIINVIVNARPASIVESVDVVVSNPDGQSAVLENGFTFRPVPRIDGVSVQGKELVVFGDGFDRGAVIVTGGRAFPARVDVSSSISSIFLRSKQAARRIAPGQTVVLVVSLSVRRAVCSLHLHPARGLRPGRIGRPQLGAPGRLSLMPSAFMRR